MTSLYEISMDISLLANDIENSQTPEENDEIMEKWNSLQMDFNTKIENTLKVMRDADTDYIKIIDEIVRLNKIAESKKRLAERLKNYVSTILQSQWIQKIDFDLFKLSFRKSESLEIVDENLIPLMFKETIVTESLKIDKNRIKDFIKTASEDTIISVPWVKLVTKQNLQIK